MQTSTKRKASGKATIAFVRSNKTLMEKKFKVYPLEPLNRYDLPFELGVYRTDDRYCYNCLAVFSLPQNLPYGIDVKYPWTLVENRDATLLESQEGERYHITLYDANLKEVPYEHYIPFVEGTMSSQESALSNEQKELLPTAKQAVWEPEAVQGSRIPDFFNPMVLPPWEPDKPFPPEALVFGCKFCSMAFGGHTTIGQLREHAYHYHNRESVTLMNTVIAGGL